LRHDEGIVTLRDYLEVLRRRRLIVVGVALLGMLLAFGYGYGSGDASTLYRASADGLLNSGVAPGSLDSSPTFASEPQAIRIAETQAEIASAPVVARRVLAATGTRDLSTTELLAAASVSPKGDTAFLTFTIAHIDRGVASRLASEYARQALLHRKELETLSLRRARRELETRIAALNRQQPAEDDEPRPLLEALVGKANEIRTLEALQAGSTLLIQPPTVASIESESWARILGLGLALGLVLGIVVAFVRESLDTRVRSAAGASSELRLPLLGRVPRSRRRHRATHGPAMLVASGGMEAEAFRKLRTTLHMLNRRTSVQTVMVTSAIAREGKSSVVANLGVAFARAGQRVILVDLDLRNPSLQRIFGLEQGLGLTDVVGGQISLDQALTSIALRDNHAPAIPRVASNRDEPPRPATGNGHSRLEGRLEVLGAGKLPTEASEFVSDERIAKTLREAADRADLVIIDTPPLLAVADALSISTNVDAMLLVVQLRRTRQSHLVELDRALTTSPALKLGVVAVGTREGDESHAYYQDGSVQQSELALARLRTRLHRAGETVEHD